MMRKLLVLWGFLVFPGAAYAQVCIGNAPLNGRTAANVAGGAEFFDGGTSYGTGFNVGKEAFLSAGFALTDLEGTDLSLKTVSLGAGYQVPVGTSVVVLCPSATVGYGFGLELLDADLKTWTVTPALAVGMQAQLSPSIDVLPYGQVGLVYMRTNAGEGPFGDIIETETDGILTFGVSVLFNRVVTLGPSVSIPLASDNGDTLVGVSVSVGFGGPF